MWLVGWVHSRKLFSFAVPCKCDLLFLWLSLTMEANLVYDPPEMERLSIILSLLLAQLWKWRTSDATPHQTTLTPWRLCLWHQTHTIKLTHTFQFLLSQACTSILECRVLKERIKLYPYFAVLSGHFLIRKLKNLTMAYSVNKVSNEWPDAGFSRGHQLKQRSRII